MLLFFFSQKKKKKIIVLDKWSIQKTIFPDYFSYFFTNVCIHQKLFQMSTFNIHFCEEIEKYLLSGILTIILLFTTTSTFANSVDPDQLASSEAN